tara:strand:+ start:5710 stop:5880 length:171 start_codon:yes stop_codon:yes gene_type:complete
MSIELELSVADYTAILNWYELAFAKSKQQNEQDGKTLKKVSVMAMTKIDEVKQNED